MSEKDYFNKSITMLSEYIDFAQNDIEFSEHIKMNSIIVFFDSKDPNFNRRSSMLVKERLSKNSKNVFQVFKDYRDGATWSLSKPVFVS